MSVIEYLKKKFDMLCEIYENEKDPQLKSLYQELMYEIAYIVGKITLENQTTEDLQHDYLLHEQIKRNAFRVGDGI